MAIRWATAVYRSLVYPTIFLHRLAWRRRVVLDQALERHGWRASVALGLAGGGAAYLCLSPLRPAPLARSSAELAEDETEVLSLMRVNVRREFPEFALERIAAEVVNKVLVARDRAALRLEQSEVDALKRRLAQIAEEDLRRRAAGVSVDKAATN